MSILGILLIASLVLLSLAVYAAGGKRELLRESVLIGFLIWGVLVLVSTEIFSFFHVIGFFSILFFWLVSSVLALGLVLKHRKQLIWPRYLLTLAPSQGASQDLPWLFVEKFWFNQIVLFAVFLGIMALLAPPNTYDAMTYHMARVMHWIQDRSVAYYPTHIPRQLYYSNFAEYIILHFQILSGYDRWANLVQWLCFAGSMGAVSLIAQMLGASSRGQVLASLMAATIPMGVLEATSTQTDYVVTLWLCIFVYFMLKATLEPKLNAVFCVGLSLGLAVATKGITFILAVGFVCWLIISMLKVQKSKAWRMIVIILLLALLGGFGNFYRNSVLFNGHAAKVISADADSLTNEQFCWEGFWANIIRNIALHVITPSVETNTMIQAKITQWALGHHIDLNNKKWSYIDLAYKPIDFRSNEDYLGNPWHLLMDVLVTVAFFFLPFTYKRRILWYMLACWIAWILFCLILKWQPWNSRFHLPLFVFYAPIAGVVLEKIRWQWVVSIIAGIFLGLAWVIGALNVSKPFFSSISPVYPQNRDFLHFMMTADPKDDFLEYKWIAANLDKLNCQNLGLIMGADENEYLIWDAFNPTADPHKRIESVAVDNVSAKLNYPLGPFTPDVIVTINSDRSSLIWNNNFYHMVWQNTGEGKKMAILIRDQQ